ncbi:MAG: NAD-dependent epimerase/dehydratase family protein [Gemmatimonadaceae bacterium]|nr:NAD-dependent epimerase/dehydratase family protein [Gemmatimonadaceae bacterium]
MPSSVVLGAGGFIGSHLVKRLKREGFSVRGADLKRPEFGETVADDFMVGDLRDPAFVHSVLGDGADHVYQLAADMGGAGFIFTGDNDADVMHNSATINLNVADASRTVRIGRLFYSSSACIYPERNQLDPSTPVTAEASAYPAAPDSEYGWEKLFSERMYAAYSRNYGLTVRMARFHNIFGEEGTWTGGREKAPAAMCRKVAEASDGGSIEVWGDGLQTRSFLYIEECLEGVRRLMESDVTEPLNIGSEEMITINGLAEMVAELSGKSITIRNIPGPTGVRGRNSDNTLIRERLGWAPSESLKDGIERTYAWVARRVKESAETAVST